MGGDADISYCFTMEPESMILPEFCVPSLGSYDEINMSRAGPKFRAYSNITRGSGDIAIYSAPAPPFLKNKRKNPPFVCNPPGDC